MTLTNLLDRMSDRQATDLYLSAGNPPILRINGRLEAEGETPLGVDGITLLLGPLLTASQQATVLAGDHAVPVQVRHESFVVAGQVFGDAGTLAGAFHWADGGVNEG